MNEEDGLDLYNTSSRGIILRAMGVLSELSFLGRLSSMVRAP